MPGVMANGTFTAICIGKRPIAAMEYARSAIDLVASTHWAKKN
jgi:hypothetical protein